MIFRQYLQNFTYLFIFCCYFSQGLPAAIASLAIAKNRHVAVSKQTHLRQKRQLCFNEFLIEVPSFGNQC